jgi:nucleotide-binding universal stress UspA family protein
MLPFRRMLVPLAGRESDDGLLRYAAMVRSLLCGLETLCLHVSEDDSRPEGLERRIADALPGSACEIVSGDLLDTVLDIAAGSGADLILVGHSSRRRRRSLARRLAMKAPSSVWMVPDGAPATVGRILAPFDFSRRSADTLGLATMLAEASGSDECLALHVHFNEATVTFDEFDEILAEDRDRAFGIFIAPIGLHGVWAKPLFVEASQVAQTIVRTAEEQACGLIVMGTRGRSTSAAVLLGSETEHCMMTTQVPLLAVKHFGARLPLLQALRDERLRKRGGYRFT